MAIFRREFKTNFKGLLIWSASLAAVIILLLSMYPQFAEDQQGMQDLLAAYPESLKNAFGMDTLDFASLIGFYGIQTYMMLTLLGSIYAALFASNIIAKEENEHTIEFLLAKPVSRAEVVRDKLLTVFVNLLIFNVVGVIASLVAFQFSDEQAPLGTYFLLAIGAFLLHITFAAIAFMLSARMKRTKKILSVSLALVIVTYFLSIMSGVTEALEPLKYFTPFEYVNAANIVMDERIEPLYMLIMLMVILTSTVIAFLSYKKKDLSI